MEYLPTKGGLTVHGILSGGGGFHPTGLFHDVGGVPTYYKDIEKPEVLVPHDYGLSLNGTGHMVKKPHKPSRYVSFEQPKREPGVFPTTIGDMGGSGIGIDSYHQFKPADGLAEALALAVKQQEDSQAPHQWVKPEHLFFTGDKTNQSMRDYFENVAQDYQREKIEKLIAKGFSQEEIKRVIDKEREKSIEAALKNPADPNALMQAELARSLPAYLQPDYPDEAEPGSGPTTHDLSFYQLAEGKTNTAPVRRRGGMATNAAMRKLEAIEKKEAKMAEAERKRAEKEQKKAEDEALKGSRTMFRQAETLYEFNRKRAPGKVQATIAQMFGKDGAPPAGGAGSM